MSFLPENICIINMVCIMLPPWPNGLSEPFRPPSSNRGMILSKLDSLASPFIIIINIGLLCRLPRKPVFGTGKNTIFGTNTYQACSQVPVYIVFAAKQIVHQFGLVQFTKHFIFLLKGFL